MAKEKLNMEVNVTMTEAEYEGFKLFRQMEDKDYLESQIKKNQKIIEEVSNGKEENN